MLSERKAAILQAIVEGYIATSEPVGSSQIVSSAGLEVSSATVRAEMSALEDAGYLVQPHTSAGRIPSDKGYRYFVDSLMEPYTLGRSEQRKVSSFFAAAQGELERMLADTSSFLAQLTDYAALVVGPSAEASPARGLQVVQLPNDQVTAVVVHANGTIHRAIVAVDDPVSNRQLAAIEKDLFAAHVERRQREPFDDATVEALYQRLDGAIRSSAEDASVFVGGTSTVAGIFDAMEKVQDVLRVLEKQYLVVTLLRSTIDRGLNVAIGAETGVEPLAECSLVVAPIEVDGHSAGSIGLLGPTHMHYPEAMATVALVSDQLAALLREGAG